MDVDTEDVPQALDDIFGKILHLKQDGSCSAEGLDALLTAGAAKILDLKSLHREMCENTEALRVATTDAKIQLDQSSLQLQSLLYEKQHYEKEIQACTSFRSAFPEQQLELLPVQDYLAHAASSDAADQSVDGQQDPHQLMMDRLHHEVEFRQATVQELEALKAKRDAIAADVAQRRGSLSGLDAELAKLRASAQRIQKQYNVEAVGIGAAGEVDRLAALLPAPLYLLFTSLRAVAAVEKLPLQVSIAGEQASALRKQMHQAIVRSPSTPANVFDMSLARAAQEALSKSHTDDGGGGGGGAAFPLAVSVSSSSPSESPLIATFYYIPSLHHVTVQGADVEVDGKLASLFGEIEKEECVVGVSRSGKSYAWAQRACGLDLLPPVEQLMVKGGGSGGSQGLHAMLQYQHESRAAAVAQKLVQIASL